MRFPRPDQDRRRNVFGWPSDFVEELDLRDPRECIRLEVVGLASEIATQASRIQETLRHVSEPAAQRVADRSGELALHAWSVLQPQATVHEASEDALLDALVALRREQRTMLKLREQADEIARSGRRERHTVWAALQASVAGRRW